MASLNKSKPVALHFLGAISFAASQWILLAIFTKYYSLIQAGEYVFYLAVFTPLSILFSFGLRNSMATDIKSEFSDWQYLKARFFGLFLFLVFSVLLIFVFEKSKNIGFLVLTIKFIDLVSDIVYGAWLREGLGEKYGVSQILRLLSFLFLLILLNISELGIDFFGVWLMPISMLFVLIFYDLKKSTINVSEKISFQSTGLVKLSLPLAVGTFAVSLNSSMPRLVVENISGEEALAIYAVAIYFVSVAQIPVNSLMQISVPKLAKLKGRELVENRMAFFILKIILAYGAVFVLALYFLGEMITGFLYKNIYILNEPLYLVVGVSGALVFFSTVFNGFLVSQRKFKLLMGVSFYNAFNYGAITFCFAFFYGPGGEYWAYMMASLISVLVLFSFFIRVVRNEHS